MKNNLTNFGQTSQQRKSNLLMSPAGSKAQPLAIDTTPPPNRKPVYDVGTASNNWGI